MIIADNHCHILKEYFEDPIAEIKELKKDSGLAYIVSMGLSMDSNKENVKYKKQYRNDTFYRIGLGLHPSEVIESGEASLKLAAEIIEYIHENRELVDFVGEIGIDFTYPNAEKFRQKQLDVFRELCLYAKKIEKPVSIHCREAWDEVIGIIDTVFIDNTTKFNGYLHSFTGNFDQGMFFIEKGFKLGLNGIVTFKKSEELRQTVQELLNFYSDKTFDDLFGLETDTPYLSPEPRRSERNNPRKIIIIKEYLTNYCGL